MNCQLKITKSELCLWETGVFRVKFHTLYEWAPVILDAFAEWAHLLGKEVIVVEDVRDSNIQVDMQGSDNPDFLGQVFSLGACGFAAGFIAYNEDKDWSRMPRGLVATTARHEFGHVLGLDHTWNPFSVMFPNFTFLQRWIWGSDRRALARLGYRVR